MSQEVAAVHELKNKSLRVPYDRRGNHRSESRKQFAQPRAQRESIALRQTTEPVVPEPNAREKSPAPHIVVECWCGMVGWMDRWALDRFTRDIWKRFDHRDLEPLRWAIIRRRRVLAMQLRP